MTRQIYHVKYKKPPTEEIEKRLVIRSDDTVEKMTNRIRQYHKNTTAVSGSYSDKLVVVDGNRAPKEVFPAVCAAIDNALEWVLGLVRPSSRPRRVSVDGAPTLTEQGHKNWGGSATPKIPAVRTAPSAGSAHTPRGTSSRAVVAGEDERRTHRRKRTARGRPGCAAGAPRAG